LRISVKESPIGIMQEQQAKLFQPLSPPRSAVSDRVGGVNLVHINAGSVALESCSG
jgi:hypothetical protein